MTKVAILPVPTDSGDISYNAVAGDKWTKGKTAGEALDALTAQLTEEDSTLVIVQSRRPDRFFSAAQHKRLSELMDRWRVARDKGDSLSKEDQAELQALVEEELEASSNRAAALVDELKE
ncbi:MAG: hypothetical protein ACR2RB_13220 [Gammaproteobacteria bacterium]